MNSPMVSVVMSVFNDQHTLEATVKSILSQQEIDLEFVIINDGSTDNSEEILRRLERSDQRIRLYTQQNTGLTKALIAGCEFARGKYIARQDSGDYSLPGRLKYQLDRLDADHSIALCSTGVEFLAPDGEVFNSVMLSKSEAENGLKQWALDSIKGPPHHGSVMFRKSAYQQAGGYRAEFKVAQDLDLWTRMIEYGHHASIPKILYQATANITSISNLKRDQQIETANIIFDCCRARAHSGTDQDILSQVTERLSFIKSMHNHPQRAESEFYYFIGASLNKLGHSAANKYLAKALRSNPFHWKAIIRILGLKR